VILHPLRHCFLGSTESLSVRIPTTLFSWFVSPTSVPTTWPHWIISSTSIYLKMWLYLLLLASSCLARKSLEGSKPNIVILLMDDMGWGDLGHNGEPNRETPRIDQMAAEGLTATSMYTSAPLCSP
ncbi:unnamed protein product, partial [Meganyctiphanes norvegica]